MQENINNIEQEAVPTKRVSIGALLVSGRNSVALSQVDVAEQINLPVRIISALEQDDFDSLPESTYVQGYLRNYSRAVGIDANSILKVYKEQYHQEPEVEPVKRSSQSYDPAILWSTAAVMSILVGLVITWWFDTNKVTEQNVEVVAAQTTALPSDTNETSATEEPVAAPSTAASNAEGVEMASTMATASQDPASSKVGTVEETSNDEVTADQQHAMEAESRNPNLITSIDGASIITVTYMEKSWTEIRDADANTLMQGLIEPGVVRDLSGKPPFEVFLGNAPGVVIEVNGQYFDHSQYSRSNRTARFQVSSGSLN